MENNNITLTAQVISPQSEEYSCLDFFFKYTRIKILRRERKTLAIVQIITALIMFAVGIVMHDSALLISSIGLLYWMPLIFLVSASLLIVLVDRPNKNLARACGGLYIVTALISFVSVILLATGRDNNWSYCSPPESSMCRLVKIKEMYRDQTNWFIGVLWVLMTLQSIMNAFILQSFQKLAQPIRLRLQTQF